MARRLDMSVQDFLEGGLLRRSDVVLCASRKSLIARLIRYGTQSLFNHAALVFLVPPRERDLGFEKTFLIESVRGGVDITDIGHYVSDPKHAWQVAIKRLDQEWFQGPEGEGLRKRVRGHMLNHIKAEYDYRTVWQLAKRILDRLLFGIHMIRRRDLAAAARKSWMPSQFICGCFVQFGFWDMLQGEIEAGRAPPERAADVEFAELGAEVSREEAMLATTPEQLARTEKLAWKYVLSRGEVWEVANYDEACALIAEREG